MELLDSTLNRVLANVEIVSNSSKENNYIYTNEELVNKFISAKRIEGCSEKTIKYYSSTVNKMISSESKHITHLTTDDLRTYLANYQTINDCSKTNIDNIRRNLSSFFSWLEKENYIIKSPMKRIHKIEVDKVVKETYSDEVMELSRDNTNCIRDLAMIDLLESTVCVLAN